MFDWLEYLDWENACSLLGYQLERKSDSKFPNRHFDTLSFYFYSDQFHRVKREIETSDFFELYIQTGFLLSDEKKVFSILYPEKKGLQNTEIRYF